MVAAYVAPRLVLDAAEPVAAEAEVVVPALLTPVLQRARGPWLHQLWVLDAQGDKISEAAWWAFNPADDLYHWSIDAPITFHTPGELEAHAILLDNHLTGPLPEPMVVTPHNELVIDTVQGAITRRNGAWW